MGGARVCAVRTPAPPRYFSKLTPASVETLGYQGGPMTESERLAFENFYEKKIVQDAIALRTCDERGKVAGLSVAGLETYEPALRDLMSAELTSGGSSGMIKSRQDEEQELAPADLADGAGSFSPAATQKTETTSVTPTQKAASPPRPRRYQVLRAEIDDHKRLCVDWGDGHRSRYHGIWLRDNDQGPQSKHANGQRLFSIVDLKSEDCEVAECSLVGDDMIQVSFKSGFVADFAAHWLRNHCYSGGLGETASRVEPVVWTRDSFCWADDLPNTTLPTPKKNSTERTSPSSSRGRGGAAPPSSLALHKHNWALAVPPTSATTNPHPQHLLAWLSDFAHRGFFLLRNCPVRFGQLFDVVTACDGNVRHTNYGDLFDVKAVANPINLAFTADKITPHTDNPYRCPTPTVQVLFCLKCCAEESGGLERGNGLIGKLQILSKSFIKNEIVQRTTVTERAEPTYYVYPRSSTEVSREHQCFFVQPTRPRGTCPFQNLSLFF